MQGRCRCNSRITIGHLVALAVRLAVASCPCGVGVREGATDYLEKERNTPPTTKERDISTPPTVLYQHPLSSLSIHQPWLPWTPTRSDLLTKPASSSFPSILPSLPFALTSLRTPNSPPGMYIIPTNYSALSFFLLLTITFQACAADSRQPHLQQPADHYRQPVQTP